MTIPRPLSRRGPPRRILVLGAGLAGLCAAHELAVAGHEVRVLEARPRPGGRVRTLRAPFPEGLYAEAGATFLPAAHPLPLHYARLFGLPVVPIEQDSAHTWYVVRGRRIAAADPAPAWPLDLAPAEQGLTVGELGRRYLQTLLDRPGGQALDGLDLQGLLRRQGASPAAIELLCLGFLDLAGDGPATISSLAAVRDLATFRASPACFAVWGGNDRLADAFAARLGARLFLEHRVLAVEQQPAAVLVHAEHRGVRFTLDAQQVVCTLPVPLLRDLPIHPPLSEGKRRALAELRYTSVSRVYLSCAHRAGARPVMAQAFTDLPFRWVRDASSTCPGPGAVLEGFTAGPAAREVAALDEPARLALARRCLEQAFPGLTVGAAGASCCWDDDPHARGAYAWFQPGQFSTLAGVLAAPEGRLHFAGEHTSPWPGWTQGALASGLRAAHAVNDLP
jgi:monoamine oxidase